MLPWLGELWGNASSAHAFGRRAREATEAARDAIASLLGGRPEEVVLTASGTEANNAVLHALASGEGLVLSAFEHPSIDRMAARLTERGVEVRRVRPDRDGVVSAGAMLEAVDERTRLVCLMLANNEVGTLQPVSAVAEGCRELGVPLLCDAVQAIGKIPVSLTALDVDYLSLGGHKFHGPLGAAALWIRTGAPFAPYLVGGSQERQRRASTVNVAAAVGLGRAAELAATEGEEWAAHSRRLRDRFERGLARLADVTVHGARAERLPNTTHAAFAGVEAQSLMIRLDLAGQAVSTGSACSSGAVHVSRTMAAMGIDAEEAMSSLRVSFGKGNTEAEVDGLLATLEAAVTALREARTATA